MLVAATDDLYTAILLSGVDEWYPKSHHQSILAIRLNHGDILMESGTIAGPGSNAVRDARSQHVDRMTEYFRAYEGFYDREQLGVAHKVEYSRSQRLVGTDIAENFQRLSCNLGDAVLEWFTLVKRSDFAFGEQPARIPIDDAFQFPPDRVQIGWTENAGHLKIALLVKVINLGLSKFHS
jgi:hypothetical protein